MKDAVICFRISKDLRRVLEKISEVDRRSLSATIENILHKYADQRGNVVGEEKRRHQRRKIKIPALVSGPDGAVHGGMLSDISLGGLHVSVAHDHEFRIGKDSRMSIVFALPESDRPLTMRCVARHTKLGSPRSIGASFIEEECEGRETLGHYLAG
jgi:hypothetical protein